MHKLKARGACRNGDGCLFSETIMSQKKGARSPSDLAALRTHPMERFATLRSQ